MPVIALTMIVKTIETSHTPANSDMTRATGFFTIRKRRLSGFINPRKFVCSLRHGFQRVVATGASLYPWQNSLFHSGRIATENT